METEGYSGTLRAVSLHLLRFPFWKKSLIAIALLALAVAGCLIYIFNTTSPSRTMGLVPVIFGIPLLFYLYTVLSRTDQGKVTWLMFVIMVGLEAFAYLGRIFLKNNPWLPDPGIPLIAFLCLPALAVVFLLYPALVTPAEPEKTDPDIRRFFLNLAFDDAFRLCLNVIRTFPLAEEPAADTAGGTICMVLDGARYSISLRRRYLRKTEVVISVNELPAEYDPSGEFDIRDGVQNLDRIQKRCEEKQVFMNRS